MSKQLPEFESDGELEAWFENADLDEYDLDEMVEVEVSGRVALVFDGPWVVVMNGGTATTTSGHIEGPELVPA